MLIREKYLERLRQLQDQKVIKVITGVRRCGKSTILELFRDDLRQRGVKRAQIQAYNFEEEQNTHFENWQAVHRHIESKLIPTEMNYIFLDEVQVLPDFERMVSSLFTKENVDIYITGSNAFLLSGELATFLTGRYISTHVLPYSFAEYCQSFPDEPNVDRLFDHYLVESSFPEAVSLSQVNPELAREYVLDVYNTIVERDIMTRYNIRDKLVFNRVVKFLCDSVGSPVSAYNVSNALKSEHIQVSDKTILQYFEYLTKSFLIYPASRYDIRGRRALSVNDKFYLVDLGLWNSLLGRTPHSDLGHRLENIVYLELLRRSGRIYVGKHDVEEIDFVVDRVNGEREYFQVAYTVSEPETLARELRPLQRIHDNFPKTIITRDTVTENFEGIKKVNVVDWLLEH